MKKPLESVRKAVDLCKGLDHLSSKAKSFYQAQYRLVDKGNRPPEMGNNHHLQDC